MTSWPCVRNSKAPHKNPNGSGSSKQAPGLAGACWVNLTPPCGGECARRSPVGAFGRPFRGRWDRVPVNYPWFTSVPMRPSSQQATGARARCAWPDAQALFLNYPDSIEGMQLAIHHLPYLPLCQCSCPGRGRRATGTHLHTIPAEEAVKRVFCWNSRSNGQTAGAATSPVRTARANRALAGTASPCAAPSRSW